MCLNHVEDISVIKSRVTHIDVALPIEIELRFFNFILLKNKDCIIIIVIYNYYTRLHLEYKTVFSKLSQIAMN